MINRFLKSRKAKIVSFIYALFSLGIVLFIYDGMVSTDYDKISQKTILDTGWDVLHNGEMTADVDLTKYEFEGLSIGDELVLKTTVPTDWDYKLPGLTMYIRQVAIRVLVDGENIYEYGYDRYEQGKTVGTGYQIIDFSQDYKGKELAFELKVSEDSPFTKINPIFISESKNVLKQIVVDNRIPLLIGAFLIVLGFSLSIVSLFAMVIAKKYLRILFLAAFSISIGIWTLCYYDLMNIFAMPVYTMSLMEYMALFLMPIPLTAYMFWFIKALDNKRIMRVYKILYANQILVSSILITLHTLDIAHAAASLPYFQVYLVVWVLFTIVILYKNLRKKVGQSKLFLGGSVIVTICVMADLVNYVTERYFGSPFIPIKGMFSIGILVFLINILIELYYDAVTHMIEDKEKQMLIDRACTDGLTGLYNHRYCVEYMEKIDQTENLEYVIVSIDLNDLKKINDQYGHLKGDELLRKAANIIKDSFDKEGIVGRIGGDEFLVIMKNHNREQTEELMNIFAKKIEAEDVSMAYGYAMSTDIEECNTSKVYQLADKRMYQHKKETKSQNK